MTANASTPCEGDERTGRAECNDTDTTLIGIELDLSELINLHEEIEWKDVPGIGVYEASAWTERLTEARDKAREGGR